MISQPNVYVKFAIKQLFFVFFLVIALYTEPLLNYYAKIHVIKPCEIENILSRSCEYDNEIAVLANKLVQKYPETALYNFNFSFRNHLESFLPGQTLSIYMPVFINGLFWMVIMNLMWLVGKKGLQHFQNKSSK